jgi:hypothetical protein
MKLPNGERAIVELEKLRQYCLDPAHPRGRHKARVFLAALGISAADAATLRNALVRGAATEEASAGQSDVHGTRYTFNLQVRHGARTAVVRCHWIVRRDEDMPRLVTCYVA